MRLDDEKLEALRRWGQGLRQADGEEHAAAGRAILMLIEEVERLRLELLRERERLSREGTAADLEEPDELTSTLHERLQSTSPQSWLETLRRTK
jgi:hypothetical protein